MILKRKEENATKTNNEAKAKILDKMLKGKFNNPIELQTFLTQANASLKGQGPIPQIP
jgi:hypothetical protein